ncbi:RsmD family RNA methyltransferase [Tistrella bauzanensis]|uniref:RsmD family RNA methyltransferase n=1 Tax=Tistrella bauzanensis TaxID=657419 RepID=UPI00166A5F1E|nr:RsmD family RNA methyltransferase [Tistrella bauzanensis]
MPRIVGGRHRGRALQAPDGRGPASRAVIRPTSERAREALFDILGHRDLRGDGDAVVRDRRVADLCCGIGALGLEALSRGAAAAVFLDRDRHALDLARANADTLGETPRCRFASADLSRPETVAGALRGQGVFDLVMIDPPYDAPQLVPAILTGLLAARSLASPAIITLEVQRGTPVEPVNGYALLDRRRYGKADILILGHGVPIDADAGIDEDTGIDEGAGADTDIDAESRS